MPIVGVKKAVAREEGEGGGCDGGGRCGGGCDGVLLTPFKLITVFMHEANHAIACILTCGKVEGIQVHANEGGVTQTRGGIYWLILPAGCNNSLLP
ncbi:hypothetical protein LINGRAHAP2_LOCUS28199 [Linum grandiflorum]